MEQEATHPAVTVSAIVPITRPCDDVAAVYRAYKRGIEGAGHRCEVAFVLDGAFPDAHGTLASLRDDGEPVKIVTLTSAHGAAAALAAGLEATSGEIVLALPDRPRVASAGLTDLVAALDGADVALGRRSGTIGGGGAKADSHLLRLALRAFLASRFRDLGCETAAFRRRVLEDISGYQIQRRFLPVAAHCQGYSVHEVEIPDADPQRRIDRRRGLGRDLADVFSIYFLTKFTRRPLRFFGLLGSTVMATGALLMAVLIFQRLFLGVPLADRPALLLSCLLVVLGVQIVSVGLIAELIIFVNADRHKEYRIDKMV